MADKSDDEIFEDLIPDVVRQVYAEEREYIRRKVEYQKKVGERGLGGFLRGITEYIPYIDAPMTEEDIGPANATSDVNREGRYQQMLKKIEAVLGSLDDETKAQLHKDVYDMYNGNDSDD